MKYFKDHSGVAFDIKEDDTEKIDELIDDGESNGCVFKGITYVIDKAVTLPLLEENS